MKLNYYIRKLQELEKHYPSAIVVFEKGDGTFKKVEYTPTAGYFKQGDGLFEDSVFSTSDKYEVNAIAVN